jgi:hypothetical protein
MSQVLIVPHLTVKVCLMVKWSNHSWQQALNHQIKKTVKLIHQGQVSAACMKF